jgi:hypothetical protein
MFTICSRLEINGIRCENSKSHDLVGQPLNERPLLDRLQVLARQPGVQPAVLAKRRLRGQREERVLTRSSVYEQQEAETEGSEQA